VETGHCFGDQNAGFRGRREGRGIVWRRNVDSADKSNEIPAVQTLLAELGIAGHLVTLDAPHCQKNNPSRR